MSKRKAIVPNNRGVGSFVKGVPIYGTTLPEPELPNKEHDFVLDQYESFPDYPDPKLMRNTLLNVESNAKRMEIESIIDKASENMKDLLKERFPKYTIIYPNATPQSLKSYILEDYKNERLEKGAATLFDPNIKSIVPIAEPERPAIQDITIPDKVSRYNTILSLVRNKNISEKEKVQRIKILMNETDNTKYYNQIPLEVSASKTKAREESEEKNKKLDYDNKKLDAIINKLLGTNADPKNIIQVISENIRSVMTDQNLPSTEKTAMKEADKIIKAKEAISQRKRATGDSSPITAIEIFEEMALTPETQSILKLREFQHVLSNVTDQNINIPGIVSSKPAPYNLPGAQQSNISPEEQKALLLPSKLPTYTDPGALLFKAFADARLLETTAEPPAPFPPVPEYPPYNPYPDEPEEEEEIQLVGDEISIGHNLENKGFSDEFIREYIINRRRLRDELADYFEESPEFNDPLMRLSADDDFDEEIEEDSRIQEKEIAKGLELEPTIEIDPIFTGPVLEEDEEEMEDLIITNPAPARSSSSEPIKPIKPLIRQSSQPVAQISKPRLVNESYRIYWELLNGRPYAGHSDEVKGDYKEFINQKQEIDIPELVMGFDQGEIELKALPVSDSAASRVIVPADFTENYLRERGLKSAKGSMPEIKKSFVNSKQYKDQAIRLRLNDLARALTIEKQERQVKALAGSGKIKKSQKLINEPIKKIETIETSEIIKKSKGRPRKIIPLIGDPVISVMPPPRTYTPPKGAITFGPVTPSIESRAESVSSSNVPASGPVGVFSNELNPDKIPEPIIPTKSIQLSLVNKNISPNVVDSSAQTTERGGVQKKTIKAVKKQDAELAYTNTGSPVTTVTNKKNKLVFR